MNYLGTSYLKTVLGVIQTCYQIVWRLDACLLALQRMYTHMLAEMSVACMETYKFGQFIQIFNLINYLETMWYGQKL